MATKGWSKNKFQFLAFRFRSDLVNLIEPNRKPSLSCVEDSVNEDRTKHVLDLVQGWPENEMRECKVIFAPTLMAFSAYSSFNASFFTHIEFVTSFIKVLLFLLPWLTIRKISNGV